jgi:predicted choloylglycine hydrolase
MAVVECNCEKMVVISPREKEDFLVSANEFTSPEMQPYEILNFPDSRTRYGVASQALGSGGFSVGQARDILSGKHGFMCQYERKLEFSTLWSTVCDLKNGRIYRAEGNPSRTRFKEDNRLSREFIPRQRLR